MLLLAATLFLAAPADGSPAERHERDAQVRRSEAAPEAPKSVWRIDEFGIATHLQTGLTCPAKIATFERTLLSAYEGFGYDVGCSLDAPGVGHIAVYLAKREKGAASTDFAHALAAMKEASPDATPVESSRPTIGQSASFSSAALASKDGARSALWSADLSGWTLTFRANYPADKEKDVVTALAALAAEAEDGAAKNLAACAAAPKVERNGARVPDGELITRLALIGGLSAQESEERPAREKYQRWCVEEAFRDPQVPLLFWRNVADRNDDGRLDRLTLMTMEEPPTWNIAANRAANLLIDKANEPAPIIHELTETQGDTTLMFAFFRGRPGLAILAPLVRDIVLGKARPVAKANGKTGVVTIPKKAPGR
jgi:hypothetical protein